ncbi:MAG: hypothetical protein E7172_01530 [Firmicutes bacterium]|nr:hypothetical protein [Bacillota bacterium]
MTNVKKENLKNESLNNKISKKTYITIAAIVIGIILITIYILAWNNVRTKEKYSTSYLISTDTVSLEIKNLDEVNQILSEAPSEYFVFLNYVNDKDTYNLEKNLKSIIDNYTLSDRFYYLNVTDIMKEDNYLERINNTFKTNNITQVPVILFYKDGQLTENGIVSREDNNIINAGDFQKLLDIYGFEDQ